MSQSNLLADTDCDSLHKFKVMPVLHLTAAVMVTAAMMVVMMTMIPVVTPILVNEDDYSSNYYDDERDDDGNDSITITSNYNDSDDQYWGPCW